VAGHPHFSQFWGGQISPIALEGHPKGLKYFFYFTWTKIIDVI